MTLFDQMRYYYHARCIVFPEGSACHGVELLGSNSLETVLFLSRRQDHKEVFSRVLAPRSKDFVTLEPRQSLGSVLNKLQFNTLNLLDFQFLFEALHERGLCDFVKFDVEQYIETCETDFMRHIAYFVGQDPNILDEKPLAAAHRRLVEMFGNLRRLSPPLPGLMLLTTPSPPR